MSSVETVPNLRAVAADFQAALEALGSGPMQLMEVCGTHSHVIGRLGVRALLPAGVRLLSGPGCPVCVTAPGEIALALELARRPGVVVCTFGDMMRVPAAPAPGEPPATLALQKARGAAVRVVYSALQAVEIAARQPEREVVLIAVGFETTAPTVAAAVLDAQRRRLTNFSLLCLHKLVPPALAALLGCADVRVDGLLCPGHVSAIIGSEAYRPLAARHHLPCVVAGFEASDVLAGILALARQVCAGAAAVENLYGRAVQPAGNPRALALLAQVFAPAPAVWRGLGAIPDSGLRLRAAYGDFDAIGRHGLCEQALPEPDGCCCGSVLRGALAPGDCPAFGRHCTPQAPLGPCMVSSEGSCGAHWRYRAAVAAAGGAA